MFNYRNFEQFEKLEKFANIVIIIANQKFNFEKIFIELFVQVNNN